MPDIIHKWSFLRYLLLGVLFSPLAAYAQNDECNNPIELQITSGSWCSEIGEFTNTNATVSGLWRPEGSLNTFVGMDPGGVWELAVQDVVVSDSGTLRSWAITLNTTDPTSVNIGGITVPNYGEVMIRESDPVVARIHPNGQIIRGVNAQEMWLPRDFDENGFDTYVVAEVTRANDDEVWLGLFLGSSQWGWVRMADVIPTRYIIGSE